MVSNWFLDFLARSAILFPVFLVALSFHEFFHALAAYLLGDDTAKRMGRLTLNPLAHLDFWGTVFLLIFNIGWARPVMFDIHNFKRPKLYSVITAYSGPFANFILAIISFACLKFFPVDYFPLGVTTTFIEIFNVSAYINVMLGVFNMLPIPPLDGSHLLIALFYEKYPKFVFWLYKYAIFILIFLVFFPTTRDLLTDIFKFIYNLLENLVFNI